MKNIKYPLIGVVFIMLVFSTIGSLGFPIVDNKNAEIFWRIPISKGPILEVTTDKTIYSVGEPVTTFLTNVGDEMLSGGGPIITIYDEEDEIVYQEAVYCWHELDPGEFIEWLPWDQTDKHGQQVPVGEYVVEGILSGGGDNYVDDATFYISNRGDELDQYQTVLEVPGLIGQFPIPPYWNVSVAQSFIPQKKLLTRVQLCIARNATTTYPYVLAIREDLTGENIALSSVSADDIPVVENITDMEWIEFDFDDVLVTIGQTYYIVSSSTNETDNYYGWGASASSLYPNGTVSVSKDGGETWEDEPDNDMCFMTYGQDNLPPGPPSITGETSGKTGTEYEYTFDSIDPEDDDVKYFIDWGDKNTEWTGFNASGSDVMVKHTWSEKGDYTITAKAQDINGAQGPEGTLTVTMPKNKAFNFRSNLLSWFLERFPLLIKIIYYCFN